MPTVDFLVLVHCGLGQLCARPVEATTESPVGWGTNETLNVNMVEPELVVVGVDVARDSGGRWRHAARGHRARPDVAPRARRHRSNSERFQRCLSRTRTAIRHGPGLSGTTWNAETSMSHGALGSVEEPLERQPSAFPDDELPVEDCTVRELRGGRAQFGERVGERCALPGARDEVSAVPGQLRAPSVELHLGRPSRGNGGAGAAASIGSGRVHMSARFPAGGQPST